LLARLVGLQSAQTMASETVAGRRACDGRSKGAQRPLVLRSAAATVGDLCRTTSGHSSTSRFRLLGVTGVKAAVGGVAWAAGPRPGGARRAADRADRGEALTITDGQGCRANGRAIKIGGFSGAGGQLRGSEGGKGSAPGESIGRSTTGKEAPAVKGSTTRRRRRPGDPRPGACGIQPGLPAAARRLPSLAPSRSCRSPLTLYRSLTPPF
jgi:hypothetical protein